MPLKILRIKFFILSFLELLLQKSALVFYYFCSIFSADSLQYNNASNQVVIGCSPDYTGEVIIRQQVTEIKSGSSDNYAFKNCKDTINLKQVILPPNLENIGRSCFSYDQKLSSINVPDSVKYINDFAFNCSGLTIINISSNSNLLKLNNDCFRSTKLSSIFIPKNVESISSTTFLWLQIFRKYNH